MNPARPRRLAAVGCAAAVLVTGLGACTSSNPDSKSPSTAPTGAPPSSAAGSPVSSAAAGTPATGSPTTSSVRRSPVPSATATTPADAPAPASVSPTVSPTTCTTITVRLIPGGAVPGAEVAALQFTNGGRTRCAIGGFPSVQLLRNGKAVGSVSQSNGRPAKTLQVERGETVESQLRDFSSCQAPLSDTARITVPGSTATTQRPARLRACLLRVSPLGPPA